MNLSTYKQIDINRLDAIIEQVGVSEKAFGKTLGHEKSFISKVKERGTLSNTDILLIKTLYGVDITLKEKETKEPTKDNADVNSDVMKQLDAISNIITQFSKNSYDVDLDILERLEKLEKDTSEIAITLRTIGNLLTQINEKCMKK